jgi:hypothetical protein
MTPVTARRRTVPAVLLLFPLFAGSLAAQQPATVTARGVVVDATTGEPIAGAYVRIIDSRLAGSTNEQGLFALAGVPRGAIIEISQLGYATHVRHALNSDPLRVELPVNPIMMEALEAATDRLDRRWRSLGVAARRYTADQLIATPATNMADFAHMRTAISRCSDGFGACVRRRGRLLRPTIYIDDISYGSDLNFLLGIATHDVHRFEIIAGTQFRVYTKHFAERLATGRAQLMPIR